MYSLSERNEKLKVNNYISVYRYCKCIYSSKNITNMFITNNYIYIHTQVLFIFGDGDYTYIH